MGVAGGVPVAGTGVPVAGTGVPAAVLVAGVKGHSFPKSGHVTPEKYTPITVPRINKQQKIKIITPVCIPKLRQVFFKDFVHLKSKR